MQRNWIAKLARLAVVLFGLLEAGSAPALAAKNSQFLSHSPMRALPRASTRPLEPGPQKYVALGGDDSGSGSIEDPWRTLGSSVAKLGPGETLVIRGGTYFDSVDVEARGTSEQPITIRAFPGELVVLDGGYAEFQLDPEGAWEPVPEGAPDEFRSIRRYPRLGRAQGLFGDSMVPLHSYVWLRDLRSDESRWRDHDQPLACGPGLWYNPRSQRIHVRLAHDRADFLPAERRYRGVRDPRRVPLVVTGGNRLPLRIRRAEHVVIQDLVVRGGALAALWMEESTGITIDGVTAYSGFHGVRLERTRSVRIVNSVFRGPSAPWSSRATLKYRGTAGVLLRTSGVLRKNHDLEIASSEFTDGHDGVFLGDARNVDFHHNLVDNFNDDGIFLTSRGAPNGPIRIYRNQISRCLSSFAFGWGRDQPNLIGAGVDIFHNVITHLDPVYYFPPRPNAEWKKHFGNPVRDHGSPTWEPIRFFHNTLVAQKAERWRYLLGLDSHLEGTRRSVVNNIFVQVEDVPGFRVSGSASFESNGNLFWSQSRAVEGTNPLERFRASDAFLGATAESRPEVDSLYADPLFRSPSLETNADYRLRPSSPAIDAGVPLPPDWPDRPAPIRAQDSGPPDIGALPAGSKPLRVGPMTSRPARDRDGTDLAQDGL